MFSNFTDEQLEVLNRAFYTRNRKLEDNLKLCMEPFPAGSLPYWKYQLQSLDTLWDAVKVEIALRRASKDVTKW